MRQLPRGTMLLFCLNRGLGAGWVLRVSVVESVWPSSDSESLQNAKRRHQMLADRQATNFRVGLLLQDKEPQQVRWNRRVPIGERFSWMADSDFKSLTRADRIESDSQASRNQQDTNLFGREWRGKARFAYKGLSIYKNATVIYGATPGTADRHAQMWPIHHAAHDSDQHAEVSASNATFALLPPRSNPIKPPTPARPLAR
jgi:hypothetical protein